MLMHKNIGEVICYPNPNHQQLTNRINELRSLGVISIMLDGKKFLNGKYILGKGCTSTVVKAITNKGVYALKARRIDSNRESMEKEEKLLRFANTLRIGPTIIDVSKNFILMSLITGPFIGDWITSNPNRIVLDKFIKRLFLDCYKMDLAGLDHGELGNASKHIIVEENVKEGVTKLVKPIILDFESASINRRTSNVISLMQFLFLSGRYNINNLIKRKDIYLKLLLTLKAYKEKPSRETFNLLLHYSSL